MVRSDHQVAQGILRATEEAARGGDVAAIETLQQMANGDNWYYKTPAQEALRRLKSSSSNNVESL